MSPLGGRTVAYAGTNLRYYLYGVRFRNRVVYVNVDRHREFLMHDYHRLNIQRGTPLARSTRPTWDRQHPDRTAWLANLAAAGVDLLFVTTVNLRGGAHYVYDAEGFPIERAWADSLPERFKPVARGRDWVLYRLTGTQSHSGGDRD